MSSIWCIIAMSSSFMICNNVKFFYYLRNVPWNEFNPIFMFLLWNCFNVVLDFFFSWFISSVMSIIRGYVLRHWTNSAVSNNLDLLPTRNIRLLSIRHSIRCCKGSYIRKQKNVFWLLRETDLRTRIPYDREPGQLKWNLVWIWEGILIPFYFLSSSLFFHFLFLTPPLPFPPPLYLTFSPSFLSFLPLPPMLFLLLPMLHFMTGFKASLTMSFFFCHFWVRLVRI